MAEEKKEQKEQQQEDPSITIRYVGDSEEGTIIQGIPDGRGVFKKKNSQRTFKEDEEIKFIEQLLKTNPNFKEVK